jgi:hypothetical protein
MADNSGLIVAALRATDPDMAMALDADTSLKNAILKRGARVKKYRRYVEGEHDANLTEQMKKMLRLKLDDAELDEFNANYCEIVPEKMTDRLDVIGITTG